jgi:hypothetical protein
MILTTDLHLDDNPDNLYRWLVFDTIDEILRETNETELFILGDLCDRKDRHSGELVNQLVRTFAALKAESIIILMGNHDAPLRGTPFWSFLNELPHVRFITKPVVRGSLVLLPSSTNPSKDWADIDFTHYQAAFMHQTVKGAQHSVMLEESPGMVEFPKGLKVYSGDVHVQQTVRGIVYVGAPHPVKFGDDYSSRILILNDRYVIKEEVKLYPPRKHVLTVNSLAQLKSMKVNEGDQAQIRINIPSSKMEQWPVEQQAIAAWAADKGLRIASIEATVEMDAEEQRQQAPALGADPKAVLHAYAKAEGLDKRRIEVGLELLEESEG